MVLTVFSTVSRNTPRAPDMLASPGPSSPMVPPSPELAQKEGAKEKGAKEEGDPAADAAAACVSVDAPLTNTKEEDLYLHADEALEPPVTGIGEGPTARGAYGCQVLLWIIKWLMRMCGPAYVSD